MPKRPSSTPKDDERGVSEVLGQILVFSIVVASIGFIIATGFAGLDDTRESERFQNADRAFDVFASNMASVFERGTPSRGTEIDVGEGRIGYADPVLINVTVNPENEDPIHVNRTIRPVEFNVASGRSVMYEGGAVIRDQRRGGFTVREPPFLLSEDNVHIPIVETEPAAERTIGGTTVFVRAVSTDRAIPVDPSDGGPDGFDDLEITITSDRAEQWKRTLERRNNVDCDPVSDGEVTCDLEEVPDQVYVTLQRIRISLDA